MASYNSGLVRTITVLPGHRFGEHAGFHAQVIAQRVDDDFLEATVRVTVTAAQALRLLLKLRLAAQFAHRLFHPFGVVPVAQQGMQQLMEAVPMASVGFWETLTHR